MRGLYVTGTDTGAGKTRVAAALVAALRQAGLRAAGMKPVASGSATTDASLRNEDALALAAASGLDLPYATVNPYAYADPIAPHLAAADAGRPVELEPIAAAAAELAAAAGALVVEGVGGWMAPLGATLMQADLVRRLGLPVVLVVGLRLGCLNHALLSARAIAADGCTLLGWIGSAVDPAMLRRDDNLATLHARLPAPCLGVLDHRPQVDLGADARAFAAFAAYFRGAAGTPPLPAGFWPGPAC